MASPAQSNNKAAVRLAVAAPAGHHGVELLVVDAPVPVNIRLIHQSVALKLRHLLSKIHHHVSQLDSVDESIAISIKDFECLSDLVLRGLIVLLLRHHEEE